MASIVKAENLGKHYTLGGLHPGYATLRESLAGLIVGRRDRGGDALDPARSFWALRDVSFDMDAGETLGIVGRNGAGKSTLLKILCRITKPTTGRARLEGRVGSLLEVGTGFHPDLTGRENIFLNGTILGMSRSEIRSKFDEIVDFSEVERHLDTPVKYYSSGMYVRLAFSVAAHLDTEILIMDEVLAVGDTAFQQKCLDKMHRIRREGRTIFFVSHNMAAVTRLCRRAIYLRDGRVVKDGAAHEIVAAYTQENLDVQAERTWTDAATAPGDDAVRLRRVRVCDRAGALTPAADARAPVGIEVSYDVLDAHRALVPQIELYNAEGVHIFTSRHAPANLYTPADHTLRVVESVVQIPGDLLAEDTYFVHLSLLSPGAPLAVHLHERNVVSFRVTNYGRTDVTDGEVSGFKSGVTNPRLCWTTREGSKVHDADHAISFNGR